MTPAFEVLLDQALKLPEEERGELATRLLRSLEPDDGDEPGAQEWEVAWSAELDQPERSRRTVGAPDSAADEDEVSCAIEPRDLHGMNRGIGP
jgi:hypothetical protein